MPSALHPVPLEIFRRMTAQQKLDVMHSLIDTARELRRAGERRLHPDWTDEQIERAVRDSFLYARD